MLTDTKKTLLTIGVGEAAMLWLAVAPSYGDVWNASGDKMARRVRCSYAIASIAILSLAGIAEAFDQSKGSLIAGSLVVLAMIAAYEFALYQPECEECNG